MAAPPSKKPRLLHPKKSTPALRGAVVDVAVGSGQEQVIYHIHEDYAKVDSKYLQAALKAEWRVPGAGPIDLSDEDPSTFDTFVCWLYKGVISATTDQQEPSKYAQLAKAYVLGEKLMAVRFKNAVMAAMIRLYSENYESISGEDVAFIYEETLESSALRRLAADFYAYAAFNDRDGVWLSDLEELPWEALRDMMAAVVKSRTNSEENSSFPWVQHPDQYLEDENEA